MSEGLCHMCLGSKLEIVDKENVLCADCYPKYHRYSKRSHENENGKTYSLKDLKKKWEKKDR